MARHEDECIYQLETDLARLSVIAEAARILLLRLRSREDRDEAERVQYTVAQMQAERQKLRREAQRNWK